MAVPAYACQVLQRHAVGSCHCALGRSAAAAATELVTALGSMSGSAAARGVLDHDAKLRGRGCGAIAIAMHARPTFESKMPMLRTSNS